MHVYGSNDFLFRNVCQTPVTRKTRKQEVIEVPLAISKRIRTFQNVLLSWFKKNGRDLPWRQTRDPYHILVSEIMLHQTQVDRVIPKYHEFLGTYPSFEVLAAAPLEDVKVLWRPLGYNFRPGRLHGIAQRVVTEFNGQLPNTLEKLTALRGIGRYTAGAILCFAFHIDAPILDTNVRRVLSRYFKVQGNLMHVPAKNQLWDLAARVIPKGKGHIFNQAILDFGALVCTARNPVCSQCQLNLVCPYPKEISTTPR